MTIQTFSFFTIMYVRVTDLFTFLGTPLRLAAIWVNNCNSGDFVRHRSALTNEVCRAKPVSRCTESSTTGITVISHSPVTTEPSTEHIHIQNDYIRGLKPPGQEAEQTGINESQSFA